MLWCALGGQKTTLQESVLVVELESSSVCLLDHLTAHCPPTHTGFPVAQADFELPDPPASASLQLEVCTMMPDQTALFKSKI